MKQLTIPQLFLWTVCILGNSACSPPQTETPQEPFESSLTEALTALHLTGEYLALPKTGRPYSVPGRLAGVDMAMGNPLSMVARSREFSRIDPDAPPSIRTAQILALHGLKIESPPLHRFASPDAKDVWDEMLKASMKNGNAGKPPTEWDREEPLFRALRFLLYEAAIAQHAYRKAGGNPAHKELLSIQKHLQGLIRDKEPKPEEQRWLIPLAYHQIGARTNLAELAAATIRLQAAVEEVIPELKRASVSTTARLPIEWKTPLGRVRIAGTEDKMHSGNFLLLIDLGGNDIYEDVGRLFESDKSLSDNISIVLDIAGNDIIRWRKVSGPGAGIMGINIWADLGGDDRYAGNNLGSGMGLLGAGLLWDADGNDSYQGGALVQGAGEYGLGLLLDENGNDSYQAAIAGQGFGGPGGIGILADMKGNDSYACGGVVPDQVPDRKARHQGIHYLSMCQGFAFGIRPQASGGIGLLLDLDGDDSYKADIFSQGSAYWFGLGMLVDRRGNDRYDCFEHCQGEGIHLSAGILADWEGNDEYRGYEHAQGVGIDRGVGILYENSGNDLYISDHDSQGAGLKPYGEGLLIDVSGDDRYETAKASQGYIPEPGDHRQGFPQDQRPVGILLDMQGADVFLGESGLAPPGYSGRIQNQQGIAVKK